MNPFDLRGPDFLVFYSVLGIGVNVLLYLLYWQADPEPRLVNWRPDPYEIAYLRGGEKEAIRVSLITLMDRGLLRQSSVARGAVIARPGAATLVRRPIEKAMLEYCQDTSSIDYVFRQKTIKEACTEYDERLSEHGLIVARDTLTTRARWAIPAVMLLLVVSLVKLGVALQRGRHNIGFLIILTLVFCVLTHILARRRRTHFGQQTLRRLREELAALKKRASSIQPGGDTNELAYLAAVFGIAVVPKTVYPFIRELRRSTDFSSSSYLGWSDWGGSSCAGGGCGGGGCGGGGCGGGCGGCGG